MSLDKLRSLLTINRGECDAIVELGWMTIANIEEEDGMWFVTFKGKDHPIGSMGDPTLEEALERLIKYLS